MSAAWQPEPLLFSGLPVSVLEMVLCRVSKAVLLGVSRAGVQHQPGILAINGSYIASALAKNTGPGFFRFPVFSIVCQILADKRCKPHFM